MKRLIFMATVSIMSLAAASLTSCTNKKEKQHTGMPHATIGQIALVAGTGYTGIDRSGRLPNVQIPIPTGIASTSDGSIIPLVNSDGGTLMRLTQSGDAEPFEYYRTKRRTGGADIGFDASHSAQRGWIGQQNSSSITRTASGDLWIYANSWIAAITVDNRAIVLGRLPIPAKKGSDYETRIFRGPGADILLIHQRKVYKIDARLSLHPYSLPKGVTSVAAVASDGSQLLAGSRQTIYRIYNGHIVTKDELKLGNQKDVGEVASITPDNKGGYFAGTSAGVIFHVPMRGSAIQVAGVNHKPAPDFGGIHNCPPAGHQRLVTNPKDAVLSYPESLLLVDNQLYIADAGCSRLYALGIS